MGCEIESWSRFGAWLCHRAPGSAIDGAWDLLVLGIWVLGLEGLGLGFI